MTLHAEELWDEPGDVNEWGSVAIPDSPEGIDNTPAQPDPMEVQSTQSDDLEAVAHVGNLAVAKELIPVGSQDPMGALYMG